MKISVLLSAYNSGQYLKDAVISILNQTFSDFEFIIVNDASTDNTLEIIQSFADPRLKIINNPANLGLTKSLNIGLKQAQGKYIARMDADDISLPERLQTQYDFMENNINYAAVGCALELFGDNSAIVKFESNCDLLKYLLIFKNCFCHPAMFIRRDKLLEINGYNAKYRYAQDFDLFFRLSREYPLTNLDQVLLKYRIHHNSLTKDNITHPLQTALAKDILFANLNYYLPITPADLDIIYNALINKQAKIVTSLSNLLKGVNLLIKLKRNYIIKAKLTPDQIKLIKPEVGKQIRLMLRWYCKYKFKFFYNLLKQLKNKLS